MKYYYGNSYKEAIANNPVEITSTRVLESYKEVYAVVIPDPEVELPETTEMEIDSCLADAIEDKDYVEEVINNYLSDKYGYCVSHYKWEVADDKIVIEDIEWDLTE